MAFAAHLSALRSLGVGSGMHVPGGCGFYPPELILRPESSPAQSTMVPHFPGTLCSQGGPSHTAVWGFPDPWVVSKACGLHFLWLD